MTDPTSPPPTRATPRELGFLLADAARMLRTAADQKARGLGTTRAQWVVLARLERCEGLSQNDLAAILDIQPITLGRLVDKLCAEGLVERRPDPVDRRVNRLYLREAAHPVLAGLHDQGTILMESALAGLGPEQIQALAEGLALIKTNLKRDLMGGSGRSSIPARQA